MSVNKSLNNMDCMFILLPINVHFRCLIGLTEIAGLDIDGRVKIRGWTSQDWTMTDEFAGVDIAGLDIEGLDNGGPGIDGLDIAGLDIDGRLWAIDYNILTQ